MLSVKRLSAVLVTIVLLCSSVLGQSVSVTGSWNLKVDLGGQGGSLMLVLRQDGNKLTGTYSTAQGNAALTGTINGNNIVFDFNIQDNKIHYEGTVNSSGDQMQGTCDYGGQASGTFKGTKASKN